MDLTIKKVLELKKQIEPLPQIIMSDWIGEEEGYKIDRTFARRAGLEDRDIYVVGRKIYALIMGRRSEAG